MHPGDCSTIRARVHERGNRSLDGVLHLIELAGLALPLEDLLTRMCAAIAEVAQVEVASVYVRERRGPEEMLVMRGNVGFPAGAVGRVALRTGEGLTGLAAECLRPVSLDRADADPHYRHIPGLGEDRYPAFLALPVTRGASAAGVLVLQRAAPAFTGGDIALLAALAAPVALALERADHRARKRSAESSRAGLIRATPAAPGVGMGTIAFLPTMSAIEASGARGRVHDLPAAFDTLTRDLERARAVLGREADPGVARAIANFELMLSDRRFRERALDPSSEDLGSSLAALARSYARVPYRVPARLGGADEALDERSRDIEACCVLLHDAATGGGLLRRGAVWMSEQLSPFLVLAAVSRGTSGLAMEAAANDDAPALAIARRAGIATVSGANGLFAWARPGDLAAVDGDEGLVHINPPAAVIARVRTDRTMRKPPRVRRRKPRARQEPSAPRG
jgi:phosphotransferase system, enzyme I, PtsP